MCRRNAPVLSHITLNLPMQKASFTFIMPITCTKFIPCVLAITFLGNSSKIFHKVLIRPYSKYGAAEIPLF